MKKTAVCYTADSDTLKNLKPLRKSRKATTAMSEMVMVTDVDQGSTEGRDYSHRPGLVERILACLHAAKTKCDICLDSVPFWSPLRQRMRNVTEYAAFDAVIIGVIMLNTIVLGLYHHGIEKSFENVLDMCNLVSSNNLRLLLKFLAMWQ